MNTIKFCLNCGHAIGPEDKFCLGCGANIAQMEAQQGVGAVSGQQTVENVAADPNTQNNFQPQQPQQNFYQQPQNGYNYAQPNVGYGAPGAAVKKGDNWFSKNLKLIIIIAAVLVVGIVAFFVIRHIFFRFQKIEAKDLIKVEFNGIETAGTASAKLNKYADSVYAVGDLSDTLSGFMDDYDFDDYDDDDDDDDDAVSKYFEISEKKLLDAYTKASDKKEAQKMRDALRSERAGLKIYINGDEKSAKGLSNGDKVKIKLEYNEKYLEENNIKIEDAEYEVEVTGLKSGTKVDLFDGVSINFTGKDGSGRATLVTDETKAFIRYSFKQRYRNLKNGDKVVVVARMRGATAVDKADPEGAVWLEYDGNYYTSDKESVEKEFTVEGLTEMKKVDVFENIKIEYRYAIPYLRAYKVNTENCSDEVKNGIRYYIENTSKDLKVGDTVKILAYARSSFEEAGLVPEGTPNSDGYYVKEITVGSDAPTYLTKSNLTENADKFKAAFESVTKTLTDESIDRTSISGYSAGGKITGVTFKEVKTMLMEYNEANVYSTAKCYIVKQYVVTINTANGAKTAYALVRLRNPIVEGSQVSYDDTTRVDGNFYSKEEDLTKAVENYGKNYTVTEVGASAAPAVTTSATEEKTPEGTTTTTTKAA